MASLIYCPENTLDVMLKQYIASIVPTKSTEGINSIPPDTLAGAIVCVCVPDADKGFPEVPPNTGVTYPLCRVDIITVTSCGLLGESMVMSCCKVSGNSREKHKVASVNTGVIAW